MRRLREQRGFTLIEMLVAMGLTMVVMTAVITILTVALNDTRYDGLRDEAQDDARYMVDQLSHDLRNATSKKPDATGLIQSAGSYDVVFQSVIGTGSSSSSNTYDQQWVRYCLDATNQTIWRQTASVATSSAMPDTSACPSADTNWTKSTKVASDVTNEIGGATTRPLFTYGPTGYTDNSQIREVAVDVVTDKNPGHLPGPSPQLYSGIYLRNDVSPPAASFSITQTPNSGNTFADIGLNGSNSSDPQGQTLTYQWYANKGNSTGCASTTAGPSTGALTSGISGIYDAGSSYKTNDTWTFALVVTNTGGLTSCTAQTVTIQ